VAIRIESPSGFSQMLDLPQSVEREFRNLLLQDRGELTEALITSFEQQLASRDQNRDSNEDDVGELSGCAVVADGGVILRVILQGLRQRLHFPVSQRETLRVI
jgi:hypothetical protein